MQRYVLFPHTPIARFRGAWLVPKNMEPYYNVGTDWPPQSAFFGGMAGLGLVHIVATTGTKDEGQEGGVWLVCGLVRQNSWVLLLLSLG